VAEVATLLSAVRNAEIAVPEAGGVDCWPLVFELPVLVDESPVTVACAPLLVQMSRIAAISEGAAPRPEFPTVGAVDVVAV